jgi:hypothetical protein
VVKASSSVWANLANSLAFPVGNFGTDLNAHALASPGDTNQALEGESNYLLLIPTDYFVLLENL